MSVQEHVLLHLAEGQPAGLLRQELLEQEGVPRELIGAFHQHREFIAQGEEARRLQADDRNTPRRGGPEYLEHALSFALCLVHHAGRKECPSAAKAIGDLHPITRGFQHDFRRAGVLGFEVPVERIDEKDDVAVARAAIAEVIAAPARQRAGGEADRPFQHCRQ